MMPANVLFVVIDQWRGEALSYLGHAVAQTPNLDALAADGWFGKNHFTVAAPCGPARASLLTGLYAQNHRSVRNGTPLAHHTNNIARMVRGGGYDPVLFGYTDTSADPNVYSENDPALTTYEGVMPGFSIDVELNESCLQPWVDSLRDKGYQIPTDELNLYRSKNFFAAGFTREAASYRAEDSDMAFLVDRTIQYIKNRNNTPWFVHLALLRPHPPWLAPEPYNRLIDSDKIPLPIRRYGRSGEAAMHPYTATWLAAQDVTGYCTPDINVQRIDEQERRDIAAVYYGLLAEVDAQLGRLIACLKASGDYENTLIVVTSDHGEQLGDHWLWNKGGFFDSSYHIPLLIRDPGVDPGLCGRVEDGYFTESVDIVPTILEWLDLPIPHELAGCSLLPLVRGKRPESWRQQVFWEFDFRNIHTRFYEKRLGLTPDQACLNVIRDHRFKYVHFAALPSLLFDLQADPGELNNLAENPEFGPVVMEYCSRLLNHKILHQDRKLTNQLLTPEGVVAYTGPRC